MGLLEDEVLQRWAPQPGGSYPRRRVTGTRLSGIGGLLVFVGAGAFVLHVVLKSVLTAGVDPAVSAQAGLWVPVNALRALGAPVVLLGQIGRAHVGTPVTPISRMPSS